MDRHSPMVKGQRLGGEALNPSGPAPLPFRWDGRKNRFAVTPDGLVLRPDQFDPNSWAILVEEA